MKSVTLYVPGLFRAPAQPAGAQLFEGLDLRTLTTLLARADRQVELPSDNFETGLWNLALGGGPPAIGALTEFDRSGMRDGRWCVRADPVHLHADMQRLLLFNAAELELDSAEAEALAAAVRPLFEAAGLDLQVAAPAAWTACRETPAQLVTRPLSAVAGRDIVARMPGGADAPQWHGLMNEIQMTLHDCPVNRQRAARGAPTVNSVWFWGEGVLPAGGASDAWSSLWCDDPLAAMLRNLLECAGGGLSEGHRWLSSHGAGGRHLVVVSDVDDALRRTDLDAWRAALERLENDWIRPLYNAVRSHRLMLVLRGDSPYSYHFGPVARRRWWRRRKRTPVNHFTQGG